MSNADDDDDNNTPPPDYLIVMAVVVDGTGAAPIFSTPFPTLFLYADGRMAIGMEMGASDPPVNAYHSDVFFDEDDNLTVWQNGRNWRP